MKIRAFIISMISCLLLGSCAKEMSVVQGESAFETPDRFHASLLDNPSTKTYLSSGKVIWEASDPVAVFCGSTRPSIYRVMEETAGGTECILEKSDSFGAVSEGGSKPSYTSLSDNVAYYPFGGVSAVAYSDGKYVLDVTLDRVQSYEKNSFSKGDFPMVAVTSGKEDTDLEFKNVLGLLKIPVTSPVMLDSIVVSGNNHEKLAGAATVICSYGQSPSVNLGENATDSVAVVSSGVSEENSYEFVFSLPPLKFSNGLKVSIYPKNARKPIVKTTSEAVEIKRSQVSMMAAMDISEDVKATSPTYDSSEPFFSEGVELASLIWRLMGATEYNQCSVRTVCESADSYFAAYKNHRAITLARELYYQGICYDAVAAFGLNLSISDYGVVTYNEEYADGTCASFERWNSSQKQQMLEAVSDFYQVSNFHQWFVSLEPLCQIAISSFKQICDVDFDWYDNFFGKVDGLSKQIILSFLVGADNYGLSTGLKDGGQLISPVFGCILEDEKGDPKYNDVLDVIIHEFCHPYCNPLIEKHWSSISDKAQQVYQTVSGQMESQAYASPMTMMCETFVRTSTIRYLLKHRDVNKSILVNQQKGLGFLMVGSLVDLMDSREANTKDYPTMESFMPEFINAVNAFNIEAEVHSGNYPEYTVSSTPNLLSGVFSVSADKKVRFTRSNLVWDGSNWKFEVNQMNCPTQWDTKHVGHFYWTTTAESSYALSYNALDASITDRFFCDGSDDNHKLTVEGVSGLRVLSGAENGEVEYLLYKRPNAKSLMNYPVDIDGVGTCIVIAPDDYSGTILSTYNSSTWVEAEKAGLVCFAPNGYRSDSIINDVSGYRCMYWTSSPHLTDIDCAYMLSTNDGIYIYPSYSSRCNAFSIRLVQNVE